jgi:hypothetical protein
VLVEIKERNTQMTDISNSGIELTSNDIRNRNKRAIARRNVWRKKYAQLSELIRISKRNLAKEHNGEGKDTIVILNAQVPGTDFVLEMTLRDLQAHATEMMKESERIAAELRASAYPWI